jgi:hypothetical protein
MTAHTLESLGHESIRSDVWVATCSCHNPDGDGVGRADFRGDDAYLAYLAWAEHAAQHSNLGIGDKRTIPVTEVAHGGEDAIVEVSRGPEYLGPGLYSDDIYVWLSIEVPDERFSIVRMSEAEWDTLRGVR